MSELNRRDFIKKTALTATVLGLGVEGQALAESSSEPIFKISLAEWSIHRSLFQGKINHLDFAALSASNGIDAIEYVNQFFKDKANDKAFLKEMKTRADTEGVKSLLIMCDLEGALGDPDIVKRKQTVENHKKWVKAANYLGCHSIRVNGFSGGSFGSKPDDFDESMKLVSDGLRMLCEFADDFNINIIIENHGGNSSNAKWLMGVMKMADHHRAGTLPDFGNFKIFGDKENVVSYDTYRGVRELMPFAKGVSVKTTAWDDYGKESELDYDKVMKIVLDAGYRGYCGIEHGEEGREWESIIEVRDKMVACRKRLSALYQTP